MSDAVLENLIRLVEGGRIEAPPLWLQTKGGNIQGTPVKCETFVASLGELPWGQEHFSSEGYLHLRRGDGSVVRVNAEDIEAWSRLSPALG